MYYFVEYAIGVSFYFHTHTHTHTHTYIYIYIFVLSFGLPPSSNPGSVPIVGCCCCSVFCGFMG